MDKLTQFLEMISPEFKIKTLKDLKSTSGSIFTRTIKGKNTVEFWDKNLPKLKELVNSKGYSYEEEEAGLRVHDNFNRLVKKPPFNEDPMDIPIYFNRDGTFETLIDGNFYHGSKITRDNLIDNGFEVKANGNIFTYVLKKYDPK